MNSRSLGSCNLWVLIYCHRALMMTGLVWVCMPRRRASRKSSLNCIGWENKYNWADDYSSHEIVEQALNKAWCFNISICMAPAKAKFTINPSFFVWMGSTSIGTIINPSRHSLRGIKNEFVVQNSVTIPPSRRSREIETSILETDYVLPSHLGFIIYWTPFPQFIRLVWMYHLKSQVKFLL